MTTTYQFKPRELKRKKWPVELNLTYTSVQRIELNGSKTIRSENEELCLVVMQGMVDFHKDDLSGNAGFKDMLYLPRQSEITITSVKEPAVIMVYGAPAHRDTAFVHIPFSEIDANPETHKQFGKGENNTKRDVWHYINDDFDACRLMMGICQGHTGGWTSWPPHEHGEQREEVYTYFDMGKAFAVQCVYEEMDEPLAIALVREGDVVSIPGGYHPNVGSPAGRISFIYCMVATQPDERKFMDLKIQEIYGEKFE